MASAAASSGIMRETSGVTAILPELISSAARACVNGFRKAKRSWISRNRRSKGSIGTFWP